MAEEPNIQRTEKSRALEKVALEFVRYTDPGEIDPIDFRLDPQTESIWATQPQIAQLFESERSNISKHLSNIFDDGELTQDSNVQKLHIAGSTKPVALYSLDVTISVGYRVNSVAATRFRKWRPER